MVEFKLGHSTIVIVGPLFQSLQKDGDAYHELQNMEISHNDQFNEVPTTREIKNTCVVINCLTSLANNEF
jgi:hypothetical protein